MEESPEKSRGSDSSPSRMRLDLLIVERGLADSRAVAQRLILAGKIKINGVNNPKPGQQVPVDTAIFLEQPEKYVSRGAYKLLKAIESFDICPENMICADIGTSTGGFTDCLLQSGAKRVYCIDVGRSQLHERLRADPRVRIFENTNARDLTSSTLDEKVDLAVADLSFISLTKVLNGIGSILRPGGAAVCLIKPQFEATPREASRGKGVIRDPEIHRRVLSHLLDSFAQSGWAILGLIPSPITGGSGNREYLAYLRHGNSPPQPHGINIDATVAEAFMHTSR
jgi:23S rRNA (cytidine1920-2'-O)/16S rRNA (cytidine1409-2'-O)-methyltransferase